MRILFTSTSGLGHVQPMLPLAVAARQAGHEVRWATAAEHGPRIEALGIAADSVGLGDRERMGVFRARYPEFDRLQGEERAAFMFPRLFGGVAAPAALDGLVAVVDEWRPHLIVHEQAELAAPAVAAARGLPNVCHGFGLVVPAQRVQLATDLAAGMWARLGIEPRPFGGCYDHLYIDVYPPSLQPEDLPQLGRRVHRRPESLDAAPGDRLPDEIRARVGTGRPLVYLTFGTLFNVNPTFEHAVAALAGLDAELVVTVGPDGRTDAFGPLPDHVVVMAYVPQSLLFPHVDLVVSHAGSGTLLTAMALGLPQLCLPQAADQYRNAAACEGTGAGLALRAGEADGAAIGTAATRLLHEDSFRERARAMAAEIAGMPAPADLVPVLEELAGS